MSIFFGRNKKNRIFGFPDFVSSDLEFVGFAEKGQTEKSRLRFQPLWRSGDPNTKKKLEDKREREREKEREERKKESERERVCKREREILNLKAKQTV